MRNIINLMIVSAIGLGIMLFSYYNYQYEPPAEPWENSLMYIGTGEPNKAAEQFNYIITEIRLLQPMSKRAKRFSIILGHAEPNIKRYFELSCREKIILYPFEATDLTAEVLENGRLPSPDSNEILAGYQTKNRESLIIDGNVFKITGRLKKSVRLFAESYLILGDEKRSEVFNEDNEDVEKACIVKLTKEQADNQQISSLLRQAFERSQFTGYVPFIRTGPLPYCIYIGGFALLLFGGIFMLFNIYKLLSERVTNKWLQPGLLAICKYRKLFIAINMVYFGTVLLFMIVTYLVPEIQILTMSAIKSSVSSNGPNPLAVAVKAYSSRDVLLAAVTTFAINFPIGSVMVITLPSLILPGSGIFVAVLRSAMWGLLLAPSSDIMSGAMLPHSFTLLLEGEAYILAAFFGVLTFVYLINKQEGETVMKRYVKALVINVKGNLLVAIVLGISAIYEAIEVICMMSR